ncbi:hypothetical protein FACS1894184_20720 [Clostridia bacterium]|nr:hypothetical protein FACS1894184_20720 [Clostridia bacterium]
MPQTMTTHERISRMYARKEADRIPIMDSPWGDTIDRWVSEGLPTRDYITHFDLDKTSYIGLDNSPRYPEETIEDTQDYKIYTTKWGATIRNWKTMTSTPEHIDYRVKTPDDWREAKARMTPDDDRIPWAWLKDNYKTWKNEGYWITGGFWFGFDVTHSGFVGTERLLMAMIEEPEWCIDMFNHFLDIDIKLMDRVWDAGYTFDELHWYDDMGFKLNQFFSINMYRELLKPAHKRAIEWAHAHNIPARLHSCGDIRPLIPELLDIGLNGLNPLEVKAGMDPVQIKRQYGDKLLLHGGVNAVLWDQPDKIIGEIEKVVPALKENGGYIFASDHSIPNTVSLKDFTEIINTVKKLGSY